jgi:hypothetical protein
MKKLLPVLAASALLVFSGHEAEAQLGVGFGPELTYNAELEEFGIGARLELAPIAMPISFLASGDYLFVDCPGDCSMWDFGVSGKYTIAVPGSPMGPYFGGGLTHQRISEDEFSDSDLGFHLLGGVGIGGAMPFGVFVEARYMIMNDFVNQFGISVGVLF